MLIKKADDQSGTISALENEMNRGGPNAKRARDEFHIRSAGLKGEKESAYLIDFDYANSPNWAVIHDLRLTHNGRTAQVDHLLINRWMDVYVLETKHFNAGLKITDDGEFLRWNKHRNTYEGMASPLAQNDRHIQVLKDVLEAVELPTRLGLRISPSFQSFVLVAPTARIDRPKRFDASRVIKADQLKKSIWRDLDSENPIFGMLRTAAKIVSSETVEFVARQLASRHTPLSAQAARSDGPTQPHLAAQLDNRDQQAPYRKVRIEPSLGKEALPITPPTLEPEYAGAAAAPNDVQNGASCKACSAVTGNVLYGKYGYYFKCDSCGSNTSIKFACQQGHSPRLRKEGNRFFRECSACGSSTLFHTNIAA
ncbi:MAG: NERD domain-containing protein [Alphaproteobacteria bacterium]|nr:MAG: NERD domain-containing protein [Alphaproteobacteria bacterium]